MWNKEESLSILKRAARGELVGGVRILNMSVPNICKELDISYNTFKKHFKTLEDKGLVYMENGTIYIFDGISPAITINLKD